MKRNYVVELKKILSSKLSIEDKKSKIMKYHESDIADLLESLSKEERLELYKIIDVEEIADIFSYFDDKEKYISELSSSDAAKIITEMDSDDAKDILDELEEDVKDDIVELLDHETKTDIKLLDTYDEELIGSIMTNNYIEISNQDSVKSAMKKLISLAKDYDNVSIIYVVSENNKYYGCIELRDLIIARESDDLNKIIKTNYPTFGALERIEDCIVKLKEYSLESYPVLDSDNNLIGSITQDDVTDVVALELRDDYAKLGGLTEATEKDDSIFDSFKKRIPWLIVLLILGLVQSLFLSGFEEVISAIPALVFFQTTILGMSGNSGTQSLAVTIRLISSSEYSSSEGRKTIFREFKIGFINGLVLGLLSLVVVFLFLLITRTISGDFVLLDTLKTTGIVSVSLLISMSLASLVGALIPLFFKKIKIDPAVASGPFITTVNDICALLIYYGLSTILFIVL